MASMGRVAAWGGGGGRGWALPGVCCDRLLMICVRSCAVTVSRIPEFAKDRERW